MLLRFSELGFLFASDPITRNRFIFEQHAVSHHTGLVRYLLVLVHLARREVDDPSHVSLELTARV